MAGAVAEEAGLALVASKIDVIAHSEQLRFHRLLV